MASNRKYSPLIPLEGLSVGPTRLHSAPFGSSRLRSTHPTRLRFQPKMTSVRLSSVSASAKKTRSSRRLKVKNNRWKTSTRRLIVLQGFTCTLLDHFRGIASPRRNPLDAQTGTNGAQLCLRCEERLAAFPASTYQNIYTVSFRLESGVS